MLRARILASLGLSTLGVSHIGCTRQASSSTDVVAPTVESLELDVVVPARDVSGPFAVLLPPDWRAVDGGYMHTVQSYGAPRIERSQSGPHEYRYSVQPTRTQIEVFSLVAPEPSPARFGSSGGGGCPPQHHCIDVAGSAVPSAAAAATAQRCPRQAPQGATDVQGMGWRVALDLDLTRSERTDHRGNVCCYTKTRPCGGGRLLIQDGEPVLAKTEAHHNWSGWTGPLQSVSLEELSAEHRAQLASHWAREASFEHASVASFANALRAMIAIGAPASLLAGTATAAADEVVHAQMLYELASQFAGHSLGPAPLEYAARACATIESFARSVFVEACVNETLAIAHLQRMLESDELAPVVADTLSRIVRDELTHMDLAWRTLGWCLSVGGEVVRAAIADELDQLIVQCSCGSDDRSGEAMLSDTDALLSRWGILPASAAGNVRDATLRKVIVGCTQAALNRPTAQGSLESTNTAAATSA